MKIDRIEWRDGRLLVAEENGHAVASGIAVVAHSEFEGDSAGIHTVSFVFKMIRRLGESSQTPPDTTSPQPQSEEPDA
jgi:hypothetical protein